MAGHSKWAQIKRKKGAADAKRGQLFTKLARAISVAARDGGGDPEGNAALANAIEKAKSLRMPKDNIERAIAKGTGSGGDAAAIEAVTYEGYGPGGVAILIECLTDNRNRTAAEVRHIFGRADASLGEPGSVAWMFEKKGVLLVDADRYSEDDLMPAIDAGAEDMAAEGDSIRIVCEATDLRGVRDALEQAGVEVQSTEQSMLPKTTVEVEAGDAGKLLRLLDALDEQEDVDQVHANFDMRADVMEGAGRGDLRRGAAAPAPECRAAPREHPRRGQRGIRRPRVRARPHR
jgi:YebC/PmpR family DNA-binding regulatory protein